MCCQNLRISNFQRSLHRRSSAALNRNLKQRIDWRHHTTRHATERATSPSDISSWLADSMPPTFCPDPYLNLNYCKRTLATCYFFMLLIASPTPAQDCFPALFAKHLPLGNNNNRALTNSTKLNARITVLPIMLRYVFLLSRSLFAFSLTFASVLATSSAFAACPVSYPLPDEQLIPAAIYLKKDTNNLYWKAVYTNLNRDAIDCPTSSNDVSNNGPTLILSGLAPQSANNSAVISRVWKYICSGYCTNAGGMNGELTIQKDEQTPAIVQGNEIIGQISLTAMADAGIRLPADFSTVQAGYLFYVDGIRQPTLTTPYGAIDANLFKSPATLTNEWQQIYPFAFSISASSQQAQAGQPFTLTANNGAIGSCTSSNPAIIPNPTVAADGTSATSLVAATAVAGSRVTISCASTNTRTADITVTIGTLSKVQISSVSVDGAILNQITTFTITGKNLPDGMILTMDGCESTYQAGAGTVTTRTFQCTPIGFAGSKALTLKASSGEVYYQTTVTVADHADGSVCDAIIDEKTLKLTIPVLFHQAPSGKISVFSSTLTYLGDGKFSTSTTDTLRLPKEPEDYFDCTPAYTSDRLTILLPNIRMGNQSYWGFLKLIGLAGTSFVFQVGGTGNE